MVKNELSGYTGTLWEEWKPIPGYENKYEVSNEGRVRSLNYHQTGKTKLLKARKVGGGYLGVVLCKDREKKHHLVHRLVFEAFRGKIPTGMQINHLDENKLNNLIENLEVCTPKENLNYGTRNERVAKAMKKAMIGNTNGKANINRKDQSKPVNKIDIVTGKILNTYPSIHEAHRQTGINHGSIVKCCKGNRSHASGFKWKYAV